METPWKSRFLLILKWLALATIGNTGLWYINQSFDYILYPYVAISTQTMGYDLEESGLLTFAIMTPLSLVISYAIILLHDWTGKDWLGLEGLKALKVEGFRATFPSAPEFWFGWRGALYLLLLPLSIVKFAIAWIWAKFAAWKHGDFFAYIGFSFYDPVYAALYMRKAEHAYSGFTRRDWALFFGSILIANGLWTPIVIVIAPWVWDVLVPVWTYGTEILT